VDAPDEEDVVAVPVRDDVVSRPAVEVEIIVRVDPPALVGVSMTVTVVRVPVFVVVVVGDVVVVEVGVVVEEEVVVEDVVVVVIDVVLDEVKLREVLDVNEVDVSVAEAEGGLLLAMELDDGTEELWVGDGAWVDVVEGAPVFVLVELELDIVNCLNTSFLGCLYRAMSVRRTSLRTCCHVKGTRFWAGGAYLEPGSSYAATTLMCR
jgi:hypothetical protein